MTWNVVELRGIRVESLGGYLSALGVLMAANGNRDWADLRGWWRGGHFVLQSTSGTFSEKGLSDWIRSSWQPRPFQNWWRDVQKASKANVNAIARARSQVPDDRVSELDVLMVQSRNRVFNDVFGTGGNVGKRDLPKVWAYCRKLCDKKDAKDWLDHTLFGTEGVELPELKGAGTWFVGSNKTFNSGQDWYREGRLSPWSFLLALEGARLLRGGVHRRHGTRIPGKAVFPFMCRPAEPPTDGLIAHGKSEFWAPLWGKPATLIEIEELLRSGLAEVGGRPASAPHEFAVAALGAGVDAGIDTFVPFELRQTTSAQVFEAIPRAPIRVERKERIYRTSELLLPLIRSGWLDRLPREPSDPKQRGRFTGLKGPVEASILRVSEQPDDEQAWRSLLLLLARTQERIDRNKNLRKQCVPLPRLPRQWFDAAWPQAPSELRVARAIASIGCLGTPAGQPGDTGWPIVTNVFGVEPCGGRSFAFPAARPTRAVWHNAGPLRALIGLLHRRLTDADEMAPAPLHAAEPCDLSAVASFLSGPNEFDDELLARWIPPLSLLSWRPRDSGDTAANGAPSPLYTLMRPVLDPAQITIDGRALFPLDVRDPRKPHAASARKLVNLLLQGDTDQAIEFARRRYLAAGWRTFEPPAGELWLDPDRLAASLLIPTCARRLSERLRADWILSTVYKN